MQDGFLLDMFPQSPMNSSERTSKTSKSKINLNTEMHVNNAAILNVFQGWKVIPKPPRVKEEWMQLPLSERLRKSHLGAIKKKKLCTGNNSRVGRESLPAVLRTAGARKNMTVCRPSVVMSKYSLNSLQLDGPYQVCLMGFVAGCNALCSLAPGTVLR